MRANLRRLSVSSALVQASVRGGPGCRPAQDPQPDGDGVPVGAIGELVGCRFFEPVGFVDNEVVEGRQDSAASLNICQQKGG